MIDEKNFFDQPVKNDIRIYDNIRKIATKEIIKRDNYTTGSLLDYTYFRKYYKMIAIALQQSFLFLKK